MELIITTLILPSLAFLLSILLLLHPKLSKNPARATRRPSGPWNLSFLGSIHHLVDRQPHLALRDLAERHGLVMRLKLGEVDAVVVSLSGAAAQVVASRPRLFAMEIICYDNRDISFAPYGGYWRALRRVCMQELLGARKVWQFAALAEAEASSLVNEINAVASAGGGAAPVNFFF